MRFDAIIRNGEVVFPGEAPRPLDLAISDGLVAAHLAPGTEADAAETIDASARIVMPGVIDPHTHLGLGDPATDYDTETGAGALAGVTTVINYLMTSGSYDETFKTNLDLVEKQARIDVAFHAVISNLDQIAELDHYVDDFGITSFKFFMSFRQGEGAYIGMTDIDDGIMYRYLEAMASRPGTVGCIHAENVELVGQLRKSLQDSGRDDLAAWNESRPGFTEAEAIARAARFAQETGAVAYIVHTSAGESIELVRLDETVWENVVIETCPHYLTHSVTSPLGTIGKQNPPLREDDDVETVWEGIFGGIVSTVGSDHAARKAEKKQGTIWSASPGQPNMPMILPVLLSEGVAKRGLPIERVVELTAANPARIFGLWPQKGSLQIGADADIVIVDPRLERTVRVADLQSRADYSIYDGMSLTGWPVHTLVRGATAARDRTIVAEPGTGKYLKRSIAETAAAGVD